MHAFVCPPNCYQCPIIQYHDNFLIGWTKTWVMANKQNSQSSTKALYATEGAQCIANKLPLNLTLPPDCIKEHNSHTTRLQQGLSKSCLQFVRKNKKRKSRRQELRGIEQEPHEHTVQSKKRSKHKVLHIQMASNGTPHVQLTSENVNNPWTPVNHLASCILWPSSQWETSGNPAHMILIQSTSTILQQGFKDWLNCADLRQARVKRACLCQVQDNFSRIDAANLCNVGGPHFMFASDVQAVWTSNALMSNVWNLARLFSDDLGCSDSDCGSNPSVCWTI